jgi:hypothetical protein
LLLDGATFRYTGVNAYHLATDWSINYGCGEEHSATDVDAFFASLRPRSVVRFWAFQHLAFNKNTQTVDFATIDRVVAAAERHNQKLVVVIGNQWGDCDTPSYKNESWYAGGYRDVHNDGTATGGTPVRSTPLSYWDYLHRIVPRYADSTAVAFWEPINEPEDLTAAPSASGACTSTAPQTLRSFFDTVGGEIHRLDGHHLVSSGTLGGGQCGTQGDQYQALSASPGIDVATYHDYGNDDAAMPGDQWNGLATRLRQTAAVSKPLFVEEAGMNAADGVAGCPTTQQRRDRFASKLNAQFQAGIVGFLAWDWTKARGGNCDMDIASADPTFTLLHDFAL